MLFHSWVSSSATVRSLEPSTATGSKASKASLENSPRMQACGDRFVAWMSCSSEGPSDALIGAEQSLACRFERVLASG